MPRLIDADELKTAFPCGESVRTESVRATIDHMPTVWVMDEESHRCLTFPKEKGTSVRHWRWGDIIYRQDAIELAMQYCPDDDGTCSKADEDMRNLLDELEDLPSAVVEAETVRHGHWARHLDTRFGRKLNDIIICSCCGIAFSTEDMIRRSYCPNCGAKMDEVEDAKTD